MKHYLLYILLIFASTAFQHNPPEDHYPMANHLLSRSLIIHGKILEIKERQIIISVTQLIKGKKQPKKLKIRTYYMTGKPPNNLGLEINQSYIFMFGRKRKMIKNFLHQPYQRIKTQNDSLFIPELSLRGMNADSTFNISQSNTFNDPLYNTGYKISVADFTETVEQINETFQIVRYKGWFKNIHYSSYYSKKKEIDATTSAFNIALLNQINGWYEQEQAK